MGSIQKREDAYSNVYSRNQGQQQDPQRQSSGSIQKLTGGTAADFAKLYRQVSEKSSVDEEKKRQERDERRTEASFLDRLNENTFKLADELFNIGGAQDHFQKKLSEGGLESDPIGTIGALGMTLPGSMAGSAVKGLAEGHEIVTGRDIQNIDPLTGQARYIDDDGTIPSRQLDMGQRGSEAFDAIINIGGLGLGGTGRVGGLIGRGLRSRAGETGKKVLDTMMPAGGRGFIADAAEKAKAGPAGRIAAFGGQVLSDSAEEGADEFVQTLAETGRAGGEFTGETFDQALEAAGWGALGGAMMSGGAGAVQLGMDLKNRSTMDQMTSTQEKSPSFMTGLDRSNPEHVDVKNASADIIPTAKAQIDNVGIGEKTSTDGSFSMRVAPARSKIGIDETWIGDEAVAAQWIAGDADTRAMFAEMFNMDEKSLDAILSKGRLDPQDYVTLNAALELGREENRFSIKRDPGTSRSTVHDVYVTRIVPGNSLMMHNLAAQLGNGDVDGDMKTLLRRSYKSLLPSQMFLNPAGTGSEINFEFLPYLDTDKARAVLRDNLHAVLKRNHMDGKTATRYVEALTKSGSRAKIDEGAALDFGKEMRKLMVEATNAGGEAFASKVATEMVDAMYEVHEDVEALKTVMESMYTVVDDLTRDISMVVDEAADVDVRKESGSTGKARALSAIIEEIGGIYSIMSGSTKDASFRYGGGTKLGIGKNTEQLLAIDEVVEKVGADRIHENMAKMLKLVAQGERMNENIVGMFNNMVAARFLARAGMSSNQRIGSNDAMEYQVDDLLEDFTKVWNPLAKMFNQAIDKQFTNGEHAPVGMRIKNDDLSVSEDRAVVMSRMLDVIGDFRADRFLVIPEESQFHGMSLNGMVQEMASSPYSKSLVHTLNGNARDFVDSLINVYRHKSFEVEDKILEMYGKVPRLDPRDVAKARHHATSTWILEAFMHTLDPNVSINMEMYTAQMAANSEIARDIFYGSAEQRANAAIILALREKYSGLIDAFGRYAKNGDERWLDVARQQAAVNNDGSAMSMLIAGELNRENPSDGILSMLTRTDLSYEEKQKAFDELCEDIGRPRESMLVSAIQTDYSTMGLSSINSRLIDNKRSVGRAQRSSIEQCRNDAMEVVRFFRDPSRPANEAEVLMDRATDFIVENKYRINSDILASVFIDAVTDHLHNAEKGTSIDSATMNFQQNEMLALGGATPLVEEMQARSIGIMDVDRLLMNKSIMVDVLFNGYSITAYSGETMWEFNLSWLLGRDVGSGRIKVNDFCELLEKYPQLIRVIEPHMMTPTLNRNENGGVSQTGEETASGSFIPQFNRWLNDSNDAASLQKRIEVNKVKTKMVADPRYYIVLGSMLDVSDSGLVSKDSFDRRNNELVDVVYQLAAHPELIDVVVSNMMIGAAETVGKDIRGNALRANNVVSSVAADVIENENSIMFATQGWMQACAKTVFEQLKVDDRLSLDMRNIIRAVETGDFSSVSNGDYIQAMMQIARSYAEVVAESTNLKGDVADLNSAVFAMIGKKRMMEAMAHELSRTLRWNRIIGYDEKMFYDAMYDAVMTSLNEIEASIFNDDRFLYEDDMDTTDPKNGPGLDVAKQKVRDLLDDPKYRSSDFTADMAVKMIDEALSVTTAGEREARLEAARIAVNNAIASRSVQSLNSRTGSRENINTFVDVFNVAESLRGLINEVRLDPDIKITQASKTRPDIDTIRINVNNPSSAYTALMSTRLAREGQVGSSVATNGYVVVQDCFGLALIPHDRSCSVPPSLPVPWSEVSGKILQHSGEKAIVALPDGSSREVILSDVVPPDMFPPDAQVEIYEKGACNCPWCKNHYGGAIDGYTKNYIAPSDSYMSLLEFSQEAMNLKLKKTLDMMQKIIPNITSKMDKLAGKSRSLAGKGPDEVYAEARKIYEVISGVVRARYEQVANSHGKDDSVVEKDLKGQGVDLDCIAKLCCSVFKVTGTDGSVFISLDQLMTSPGNLEEVGDLVEIELMPITMSLINKRVESAVADMVQNSKDGKYDKAKISDVAWRALTDWSDYGRIQVSPEQVMGRMHEYNIGGKTSMIPAGHFTAEQMFRNLTIEGSTLPGVANRPPVRRVTLESSRENRLIDKNAEVQGVDKSSLQFLITAVELGEDFRDNLDLLDMESNLNMDKGERFLVDRKAAAVYAGSRKGVKDIVDGKSEYSDFDFVLVPRSFFRSEMPMGTIGTRSIKGESFVVIDMSTLRRGSLDGGVRYSDLPFNRRQLLLVHDDEVNIDRLEDAAMLVSRRFAENNKYDNVAPIRVDVTQLNGRYARSVVKRSGMKSAAADILAGKARIVYPKIERVSEESMDSMIDDWIGELAKNGPDPDVYHEDGFVRSSLRMFEPFALIAQKGGDGVTTYMPAVVSGSVPRSIDMVTGYTDNGREIAFHQTTLMDWASGENKTRKVTPFMTPNKSMSIVVDDDLDERLPRPSRGLSNLAVGVDNAGTVSGRLTGRNEGLLKSSLYYLIHELPTCALFTVNENNEVSVNPNINLIDGSTDPMSPEGRKMLTAEELDDMFDPLRQSATWEAVARGDKLLFKNSPEANLAIQKLVTEALIRDNGVMLANLLSPYHSTRKLADFVNDSTQPVMLSDKKVATDQIEGVLRNLSFVDWMTIVSKLNPEACPDPYHMDRWVPGSTHMDVSGRILEIDHGVTGYYNARIVCVRFADTVDEVGENSVNTSFSSQQRIRNGVVSGVADEDLDLMIGQIMLKHGNADYFRSEIESKVLDERRMAATQLVDDTTYSDLIDASWMTGYGRRRYLQQVQAQAKTYDSIKVTLTKGSGDNMTRISPNEMESNREVRILLKDFSTALGCGDDMTVHLMMNVVKSMYGWSYSDGDGIMEIPLDFARNAVSAISSNMKSNEKVFIRGKKSEGDRISVALLPRDVARALWDVSPNLREKFGNFDGIGGFFENMVSEQQNTYKAIDTIITNAKGKQGEAMRQKKNALDLLCTYCERTWGRVIPNGDAYYRMDSQNMIESLTKLEMHLIPGVDEDVVRDIVRRQQEAQEQAIATATRISARNQYTVSVPSELGGQTTFTMDKSKNIGQKILDGSASLSRVMSVSDPSVAIGSLGENVVKGAVSEAVTYLDWGPWGKSKRTIKDDKLIHGAAEDARLRSLFKALREVSLRGDFEAFILGLDSGKDVDELMDSLYGDQKWYSKWRDRVFKVTSMDTVFISRQIRLMLKYLDTYITTQGLPEYLMKTPSGQTQLEVSLAHDPYQFIIDALKSSSTIRIDTMRALNASNKVSMAHDNAFSLVMGELMSRSSCVNFLTTFGATGFVRYSSNMTGRILNWFMPISSINYVVNQQLGGLQTFQDLGIQRVQDYDSLRSAVVADCAKMSFPLVAAIMLAIGLIQPPDDEDKRGNYEEYLIGGMRIGQDYVFTDLTGPLMPYACFIRSCMDGKPRIDMLVDGIADVASRNPMMRVGEVLDTILNPDLIAEDFSEESERFELAPGGAPSPARMLNAKAGASVMSFIGKLVTPTFVRSWGSAYDKERSYKRVWEPGTEDVDVSAGRLGETQRVSYEEAVMRRVTRDNPIIGTFMNVLTGADTSWNAATSFFAKHEMPPVVYQDPIMREIQQEFSIRIQDENGEWVDKPDAERQQIALNIIATLQAHDDMDELWSKGFVIDGYTRKYVGDLVWQTVNQTRTAYYNWANSEDGDNYVLGNGDFQVGAAIKQQAYNDMKATEEYWTNFYYQKLNSEPMKRGVQQYMRENVSYLEDDNGNVYATGFKRGMNPLSLDYLGFKVAPGNMDDPEGTMGYYGDWDAPTAWNEGISTGERALVPIDIEVEETIPFENLAANHKDAADALEEAKNKKSRSNGGSSRSSGGRGGGGGGGGGKTIYSHPSGTNVPSARTVSGSRPYDSKFDYLRPGFETKGSREASRRSDF